MSNADGRKFRPSRRTLIGGIGASIAGAGLFLNQSSAAAHETPQGNLVSVRKGSLLLSDPDSGAVNVANGRGDLRRVYEAESSSSIVTAIAAAPGRLYLALSGVRSPKGARFGIQDMGHIVEVDTKAGAAIRTLTHPDLIDPSCLVHADGVLYVGDAKGFSGSGAVYRLDLRTSTWSLLSDSSLLGSPVSISRSSGGDRLLIAGNAASDISGGQVVSLDPASGQLWIESVHIGSTSLLGAADTAAGLVALRLSDDQTVDIAKATSSSFYKNAPLWSASGSAARGMTMSNNGNVLVVVNNEVIEVEPHLGAVLNRINLSKGGQYRDHRALAFAA